ncbi:MAG TPA: ABC transporter substrate-binding protein [Micropepsaceae bacterium]|jgi:NitT/TauT family transport system substrate-binding protein|nr:ABC transporter substrate-binding protein [Micropepsaceae bacterium]
MHKIVTWLAMAAFLFAPLAGNAAPAAPAERQPVRIEVPSTRNLQFITLWVAVGAGFFQQEGLEPRILAAAAPRNVGALLLKGDADVALLPPPMFLGMMAEEKPILLFASLLANEPINLVVRKDIADARKIGTGMSLNARLRAISGLRIGLAGEVAPRLRALFASAGMNADKDAQLVTVDGPNQVQALAAGSIDALFAHTPYLETVLVKQHAFLVADNSAGEVASLSEGQIHALATTRAEAAAKPELIAGVRRAVARALNLIHSDPKAAVDAIIASGAAGGERAELETIIEIYGPAVPLTPQISLAGIERDAALYPAHPRAPDFAHVNAADYVARAFTQNSANP